MGAICPRWATLWRTSRLGLRRTHSALGLKPQRRTPIWGLVKGAARPGCEFAGNCRVRERERNAVRPAATWSATKPMETASQRQASGPSPLASRPEHVETAVRCPDPAAAPQAWGSGRALPTLQPQSEENAERVWLRQLTVMDEGIRVAVLFLSTTSWFQSVGSGFRTLGRVPGETHRALPVGWGSGWGAASRTHERLSLGENGARSNAPSPSSSCRSD